MWTKRSKVLIISQNLLGCAVQINTLVRVSFSSYYVKGNSEFGKFCLQGLLPFTGLRQTQLLNIPN